MLSGTGKVKKEILPVNAQRQLLPKGDLRTDFFCPQKVQKLLQRNYRKAIANWFQKSYNMVTARAQAQLSVKSFSSCFRDIGHRFSSSDCSPSQFVSHVPHRRYPSCAKKLVRSGRAFCIRCILKMTFRTGKYDLTSFWWSICLFFRKGHLQSLARQGFVFWLALW